MRNAIYFDMDGTIADLYGVENWLDHLTNENSEPYTIAAPLVNTKRVSAQLKALQNKGYIIGVVSWTAINGSKEYNKAVAKAKKEWLKENFEIEFDEIHIIKYGTRKDYVVKEKMGLIFDDDTRVREKWKGVAINPNEIKISTILEALLEVD